jgi:cobalt/nickel transport system permease protein
MSKANRFITTFLLDMVSFIKDSVSSDEVASKNGFLQRRDPRLKSISALFLLLCVLMSKNIWTLTAIYIFTILMALLSSIRLSYFFKRTLWFIPVFSLFIAIPAIFHIITPGRAVASFTVFSHPVAVTRQGIDSAVIFLVRVLASISLATLLMLSTKHNVLLKVLRIFYVPQLFVMIMGMCYRYIFLFLDIVQNTFISIKSRVGFITSTKTGQKIAAFNITGLWLKSYRMQTQVYYAMLSRGYTGEPQVFSEFHSGPVDYIILTISFLILVGTLCLNRFFH